MGPDGTGPGRPRKWCNALLEWVSRARPTPCTCSWCRRGASRILSSVWPGSFDFQVGGYHRLDFSSYFCFASGRCGCFGALFSLLDLQIIPPCFRLVLTVSSFGSTFLLFSLYWLCFLLLRTGDGWSAHGFTGGSCRFESWGRLG